MKAVTTVVADPHEVERLGTRALLAGGPPIVIVDEAQDVQAALRSVQKHRPDVLVLTLSAGKAELSAVARIRAASPFTAILIRLGDEAADLAIARSGTAHGYISKTSTAQELQRAVYAVARGHLYVDVAAAGARHTAPNGPLRELTAAELRVLSMMAEGHTQREIADQLGVSVRSVESYRARLSDKLNCPTRADLVRYALRQRLLCSRLDTGPIEHPGADAVAPVASIKRASA